MKYPILIVAALLLLSSVYGQELLVDSMVNSYDTGTNFSKSWTNPQWNNYLDFAVYGWLKLNSAFSMQEWSTLVHFTSNGDNWSNASLNGDRCISLFFIGNQFVNPTYSLARGTSNYHEYMQFQTSDLNKWAFFYIGLGSATQTQYAYYGFPTAPITNKVTQVTHSPSTFYQIKVGQSFSYKYFPGSLSRVTLIAGPNAYRESGFETLQNIKPDQPLSCITVFTGCSYTGTATSVCQNIPNFNVSTIQSIFIPTGTTLTVYDTANYSGKKVTYNQSIECITTFNWSMLVNTGAITVEDVNTPALRKSSKKLLKKN